MANTSLILPSDIGEETIVVTYCNGDSGEYPLAPVKVKTDEEEYCVIATNFAASFRGATSRDESITA